MWVPATAKLSADGSTLTLTAAPPPQQNVAWVARGSRYGWGAWPLATLFNAGSAGDDGEGGVGGGGADATGLPILPWNQALTCTGGSVPGYVC